MGKDWGMAMRRAWMLREPRTSNLKHGKESYEFIGCAMAVHREVGPGQHECFYHRALRHAMSAKGIQFEYKPTGRLLHRGFHADEFEADFIVAERLIPELKALRSGFAPEHFAQNICYLKFWNKDLGILVDFGKESLSYKRIPYNDRMGVLEEKTLADDLKRLSPHDRDLKDALTVSLKRLHSEYGLGYRDKTCRGLVRAELRAEHIRFQQQPQVNLSFSGSDLGKGTCDCLFVEDRCVLKVLALHSTIPARQRAIVQSYAKHLDAAFAMLVNFGKTSVEVRVVAQRA